MVTYKIYTTYVLTNVNRSVLYTGVTNNLRRRLIEHWIGKEGSFTTQYRTHYLLWLEDTKYVLNAIGLEKDIKEYSRIQKEEMITRYNPKWAFLNASILGYWPPTAEDIEAVLALRRKFPNEDLWE